MSLGTIASEPVRIGLHRVRAPLLDAHTSAHGTERVREVILVEWTAADGSTGWAECPTLQTPGYVTETTDEAWAALIEVLVPAALAGVDPPGGGLLAAPAALVDARLDARLRSSATSLASHLGATRRTMARCAVLAGVGTAAEQLVEAALAAVATGAEMVKVKIRPGADVDVLAAVIEAVDVPVAADANGSYRSIVDLRAVDGLGLAYLEQPFDASVGLDVFAELRTSLRTPIALDESLTSVDDVRCASAMAALDVVSVKPARLGGVAAAAEAAVIARSAGASAFVGGMVELGIGRAGAAAVAAMTACDLPTDLGPSSVYVARDICAPVTLDGDGRLRCPSGAGIGRVPDPDALAEMTIARWVSGPRA